MACANRHILSSQRWDLVRTKIDGLKWGIVYRPKLLIIFLILLNLGLTLGADIFAQDVHGSVRTSSHQHTVELAVIANDCGPSNPSAQTCFDPCHAGGCHFGHCSIAFREGVTGEFFQPTVKTIHTPSEDMIEEPLLEGPRRPPKYA